MPKPVAWADREEHAPGFFKRLEAARGIAALVVVIGHCFGEACIIRVDLPLYEQRGTWDYVTRLIAALFNAQGAVLFFFILSGFVLKESLTGHFPAESARTYALYLVRRMCRLYPAHLVVLAAWIPTSLALKDLPPTPLLAAPNLPQAYRIIYTLFLSGGNWPSVALLAANAATLSWSINPVTWSLSVEVLASLLLPAMALFSCQKSSFQRLLVLVALGWLMYDQMYSNYDLAYLGFFYAGTLVRPFGERVVTALEAAIGLRMAFAIVTLMFMLPMLLTRNRPAIVLIMEGIAAWFFVAALAFRPKFQDVAFLDHPIVCWIGRISYSLYLCHYLVMVLILRGLHYLWGGIPSHAIQVVTVVPFVMLCLSLSLAVAQALYRWIETPGKELGKRLAAAMMTHAGS